MKQLLLISAIGFLVSVPAAAQQTRRPTVWMESRTRHGHETNIRRIDVPVNERLESRGVV